MIYVISISSEMLNDTNDYQNIVTEIKQTINCEDKVIIVTSSFKDEVPNTLEEILKININTNQNIIDLILSQIEIKSAGWLGVCLEKNNLQCKIMTPYQIPILINDHTIEYVEMNNILSSLAKSNFIIIPGNYAINRTLSSIYYGENNAEYLALYIYKELKVRKLKTSCHIYKKYDKISLTDGNDYKTNEYVDVINKDNFQVSKNALSNLFTQNTIDLITKYKLNITLGNKLLKGTTIAL